MAVFIILLNQTNGLIKKVKGVINSVLCQANRVKKGSWWNLVSNKREYWQNQLSRSVFFIGHGGPIVLLGLLGEEANSTEPYTVNSLMWSFSH